MKYANNEWQKNLTNVNIGIFLKMEVCEGGVVFYSSKYGILFYFQYNEVLWTDKLCLLQWNFTIMKGISV
jgi:hypothetical protein